MILTCVLIETYWNVKLRGAYTNALTESVLIETYWNVKNSRNIASMSKATY